MRPQGVLRYMRRLYGPYCLAILSACGRGLPSPQVPPPDSHLACIQAGAERHGFTISSYGNSASRTVWQDGASVEQWLNLGAIQAGNTTAGVQATPELQQIAQQIQAQCSQ